MNQFPPFINLVRQKVEIKNALQDAVGGIAGGGVWNGPVSHYHNSCNHHSDRKISSASIPDSSRCSSCPLLARPNKEDSVSPVLLDPREGLTLFLVDIYIYPHIYNAFC